MRASVVLGLVFSVPSQEIGLGKRLRNDLFCVEWDIKAQLNQSLTVKLDCLVCLLAVGSSTMNCCVLVGCSFMKHVEQLSMYGVHLYQVKVIYLLTSCLVFIVCFFLLYICCYREGKK